ncbi:MAG: ATP-binding protein [Acidobacteriaceae bacterium]|nr:ATP-binding protein [Acidobacteriaceae bacterium]
MKSGSQTRLLAVLLALLTLAAIGVGIANLVQESSTNPPTDGARWSEVDGGLLAYILPADTPAIRAGIRQGDILTAVNGHRVRNIAALEHEVSASGIWSRATYTLERKASTGKLTSLDIGLILEPADRTDYQVMRLIALVYLAIGLYVLFRRWGAPKSTHFFIFCLTSFVLYAFRYTSVLDGLDQTVFWCNVAAFVLQPAMFLQFALTFEGEATRRELRGLGPVLYLPGAVLVVLRWFSLRVWSPTERLQHRLDQVDYGYLAAYYVLAAILFYIRYRREERPLERQQLKWLTRGTLLTVAPFTAFYVIPFLADWNTPGTLTKIAVLSLILLPLTFSWAIVRYRLMDVDLIFKRGVTYTLVTAALVGLYFGVIALFAEMVHTRLPSMKSWGLVAAIIVTGLIFDPLKRIIQGRVDRLFDQKKFDYRETLIDFGKELNAQTDLRALVDAIVERLPQTMLLTRVAVFLPVEDSYPQRYTMVASHGLSESVLHAPMDMGFLDFRRNGEDSHIYFEGPHALLRFPESQRETAAALDLNYYVPCRAARHEDGGKSTVAVLGLGRTGAGDFLSSEDMVLLESLAGYVGIAIQNAQLYQRLTEKATEFERLRDFNQNIVESINIGVFAVDLEDHIESWNAQMEVMYATPRAEALRKTLADVFPVEFVQEFDRVRAEQGVLTLYKFRLPTPTGDARTANITVAPLLNRNFVPVGRIVLVDDITDRVNMESQLTQAEKLSSIGLLAAGVAHEVNTPLAVISSYAQMLGKQLRTADDASQKRLQPVLDKIIQQTFRASEIASGLLNFSRMGTTDMSRTDLNSIVRDTALLLEHQMRSGAVTLITDLAEDTPPIAGNRGKLQQVLVNLILNAKDALQEKGSGQIKISTRRNATGAELLVEDNGQGMPPEVIARIYDPFFTTKSNPKEGHRKGTGLGLSVTYGIVQEHAGVIEVTSTVGEGTTFRLEFPAESAEGKKEQKQSPTTEEGTAVHV